MKVIQLNKPLKNLKKNANVGNAILTVNVNVEVKTMFKEIKDKLKLVFSRKRYRSTDKCNVEKVDENEPVEILKKQTIDEENEVMKYGIKPTKKEPTEKVSDTKKLEKKLSRIINNTKTYRIRKKNIKRLFDLLIN